MKSAVLRRKTTEPAADRWSKVVPYLLFVKKLVLMIDCFLTTPNTENTEKLKMGRLILTTLS